MSFVLERQLCAVLERSLPAALRLPLSTVMLGSAQVGMVIPDWLAVTLRRYPLEATAPLKLSSFESTVLAALLREPHNSAEELATAINARVETTRRAWERLLRAGLVQAHRAGCKVSRGFPHAAEVIAVEAKLSRWREAVDQATSYLAFANRSFVALPKDKAADPGVRDACLNRGIGLIAVDAFGARVQLRAAAQRQLTSDWVWVTARAVDARFKAHLSQGAMPADA